MINFQTEFHYKRPEEEAHERRFVAAGTSYGFDFYVVDQGGLHPCAYVVLHKGHIFNGLPRDNIAVECHGGVNYAETRLEGAKIMDGDYVIGWSYDHFNDFCPVYPNGVGTTRWTTTMILDEITSVCRQLRELNDKEG